MSILILNFHPKTEDPRGETEGKDFLIIIEHPTGQTRWIWRWNKQLQCFCDLDGECYEKTGYDFIWAEMPEFYFKL